MTIGIDINIIWIILFFVFIGSFLLLDKQWKDKIISSIEVKKELAKHDCNIISLFTSSNLLLRLSSDINLAKVCKTTGTSGTDAPPVLPDIPEIKTEEDDDNDYTPLDNVDATMSDDTEPLADREYEEVDEYMLSLNAGTISNSVLEDAPVKRKRGRPKGSKSKKNKNIEKYKKPCRDKTTTTILTSSTPTPKRKYTKRGSVQSIVTPEPIVPEPATNIAPKRKYTKRKSLLEATVALEPKIAVAEDEESQAVHAAPNGIIIIISQSNI